MRVFIAENCSCLVVKDGGMQRMMILTMIVAIVSMLVVIVRRGRPRSIVSKGTVNLVSVVVMVRIAVPFFPFSCNMIRENIN
jgi:hypothetical protein